MFSRTAIDITAITEGHINTKTELKFTAHIGINTFHKVLTGMKTANFQEEVIMFLLTVNPAQLCTTATTTLFAININRMAQVCISTFSQSVRFNYSKILSVQKRYAKLLSV